MPTNCDIEQFLNSSTIKRIAKWQSVQCKPKFDHRNSCVARELSHSTISWCTFSDCSILTFSLYDLNNTQPFHAWLLSVWYIYISPKHRFSDFVVFSNNCCVPAKLILFFNMCQIHTRLFLQSQYVNVLNAIIIVIEY